MSNRSITHLPVYEIGGLLTFAAGLEAMSRLGIVSPRFFPPPTAIVVELLHELARPSLWLAIGSTLGAWLAGLALATILAVPLGVLIGLSPVTYAALRPVIEFLRPVPPVAMIPVAVLLFGGSMSMKVFLIVLGCFWPILIQSYYGVKDVDPVARSMFQVYRLSGWETVRQLVIPTMLPFLMTGLRVASSTALILAIGSEIIVGARGLGSEISLAQSGGAVTTAYALILVTGVLGLLINLAVRYLQSTLLFWHPTFRGSAR